MLVGAEFFLRWYYKDVLSTADGKSFFSVRSAPLFRSEINGYKLRGVGFDPSHDGRYRIAVLGDSFTYGQGVYPAAKRYTERFEHLLQEQTGKADVFVANAGLCGHNLKHHNRYMSFIEDIHPDYVLYQWYINDMDNNPDYTRVSTPHLIDNKKIHTYLWQHSALYYLIQHRYGQFRKNRQEQISYSDYLVNKMQDSEGKPAITARKQLISLIEKFRTRDMDFGIVLFPSFAGDLNGYEFDFLHEQVLAVCKEYKANCLDLRDTYRGIKNTDLWANVFDAHPGELAHELAAKAIHEHFGPYWHEQIRQLHDSQKTEIQGITATANTESQ